MFKVPVQGIEAYFDFDPSRTSDLRGVDEAIRQAVPSLQRWFVAGTAEGNPGMTMSMVGYGRFSYQTQRSKTPIDWPVVGLALQKNHLSLYVSGKRGATPWTQRFANRFPTASVSKTGAIRFRSVADLGGPGLTEMLQGLEAGLENGSIELPWGGWRLR